MTGTITVYFNTGFNGIDIPASASVLSGASSKTYTDVYYIREDIDKPQIKIKDSYDNLRNVDYCAINTSHGTSYFFAVPASLSKGVTLLSLELDALLTMGGAANLTYISGWQERGHISTADDTLFSNTAAEEWIPSQPLEAVNSQGLNISTSATKDADILISNIALYDIGNMGTLTQEVIQGIVSGSVDPVMYFPAITTVDPTNETPFAVWDYTDSATHSFHLPNTAAFDPSNTTVKEGLEKLYSCGQLELQSSYKVPQMYMASDPAVGTGSNAGRYGTITGMHGTASLTAMPFEYTAGTYTPKNKKCYSTYRNFVIVNLGSGDMISKEPAEIYDGSATNPEVNVWADPSSTGKPYARFSYIKGNPIQYSDCVKGLQWANSQIVMEGASGSLWNSISSAFQNQQLEYNKMYTRFQSSIATSQNKLASASANNAYAATKYSGTVGAIQNLARGNVVGAMGASVGTELARMNNEISQEQIRLNELEQQNSANYQNTLIQQQINENGLNLLKSNNIVAPSVSFTPEQNLGLYDYNKFVIYEVRKSDADLKSEDEYYQRFGYNGLHRPLTQQCFNERQYYNYVQAYDINLKGAVDFGLRVRTKAIAQLNNGVRVWKVLPDASYYSLN